MSRAGSGFVGWAYVYLTGLNELELVLVGVGLVVFSWV